ncbi:integrase, catalytic region, zinc finger, CCHC-type containing protein [Tanacetum coccineum]
MGEMIVNRNAKFAAFEQEIHTLKLNLSANIKENKSLTTTMDVLKKKTKEKENKYLEEIKRKQLTTLFTNLVKCANNAYVFYDENHKTAIGYQNPFYLRKAQRIQPNLYDGTVLAKKHDVIYVSDSEETLILAEDSRSKMNEKLKDLIFKEKKEFDKDLHTEINEMKAVFNQMESEVEQCSVDKKCLEIQKKEIFLENDRLLELIISQDIVHTVVNYYAAIVDYEKIEKSFVDEYNECLELKAELLKKNEMELLVCVSASCPSFQKDSEKSVAANTKNRNRRVTFEDNRDTSATKTQKQVESQCKQTTNKPLLPSIGVISSTQDSGSKSKSNTRKNMITQAASSNQKNKKVEDHPRSVMYSLNKKNRVSMCNAITKHAVVDANSKFVYSTCNDCLFSINHDNRVFAYLNDVNSCVKSKSCKSNKKEWKPTGRVFTRVGHRFGNNQVARILGYGEGLGHNLFSIGQFCDSDLEVAFQKHTCFVCNLEGIDLLTGSKGTNLYTMSLDDMMKSFPICLLSKAFKTKSWLWHQRLSHLNFGAIDELSKQDNGIEFVNQTLKAYYEDVEISHQTSFARTPQQNGVVERWNWTLVKGARTMLIFSKAPLYLWAEAVATASLCYPTNDKEYLGKLKPKADIGIFIGPELQLMTPGTISSYIVQNPSYPTPYVPPIKNDWDILFQPMFDEYFNPPKSVVSPVPAVAAQRHVDPTGTPSSTSIDQDAPSASTSPTQETQSPIILPRVEEQINENEPAQVDNDPFLGILTTEPSSEESSSREVIPSNVHPPNQPFEHLSKWTKDHPLDNVIGNPS